MAKEVIDRIRKAETDLSDGAVAAKKKAAELVDQAKADAKEERSRRLSEARKASDEAIKAASQAADEALKKAQVSGLGVKDELLKSSGGKTDKAVSRVIEALTS